MRSARGDVRDHIVLHKNDHGPSYRPKWALQRTRRLNIGFSEIFRVVRLSTFATVSGTTGHYAYASNNGHRRSHSELKSPSETQEPREEPNL
jgi:hypothetical protein